MVQPGRLVHRRIIDTRTRLGGGTIGSMGWQSDEPLTSIEVYPVYGTIASSADSTSPAFEDDLGDGYRYNSNGWDSLGDGYRYDYRNVPPSKKPAPAAKTAKK
jgi:hypothetical protein